MSESRSDTQSKSSLAETCKKLSDASRKAYVNPYTYIDWPEKIEKESWFFSPELLSLYGSSVFEELSEPERMKLSFFESVNFFSLNIHGEKSLMEGLAHRLYSKELKDYASYLHHFLDEENKHMIYFAGFCTRYAGKIYRDRHFAVGREYEAGEEDFLFFARVMIFEEIVDVYNLRMSADERLDETARKINLIHHLEEARHLVFGRQIVDELFQNYKKRWSTSTVLNLQEYLASYIISTWKEYYNPDVYKDAGLQKPYDLAETVWDEEWSKEHRREISARLVAYLLDKGMIAKEPEL